MKRVIINPNFLGKYTVTIGAETIGDKYETLYEASEALTKYLKPTKRRGKQNAKTNNE
jgi:hypothetical protein